MSLGLVNESKAMITLTRLKRVRIENALSDGKRVTATKAPMVSKRVKG